MFINTLSSSKSDTIDQCLLKYDYRYIRRFPGYESGNEDSLNFGSYIHKIFEDGHQCNHISDLENIAENLKKNYKVPFHYNDKIKTCIDNFYRFNSKLGETIGLEYEFKVTLSEGMEYIGFIDRIVKGTDGGYLIIDYKTSKREKKRKDLLTDNQLIGYAYAIHKIYDVPISEIVCAHYYPLTDNFVHVKFSTQIVNRWRDRAIKKIWAVRKKKKDEFPAMENKFCNWCEYKKMCPVHVDEYQVSIRIEEQKVLTEEKNKTK